MLYLEMDNQFVNLNGDKKTNAYEIQLKIINKKTGDNDYFNFIVNTDIEKDFEENSTEIILSSILTVEKLKKKTFCEIHDLLSSKTICLVKKIEKNKYKSWISMYMGTYRNLVITKPGKI